MIANVKLIKAILRFVFLQTSTLHIIRKMTQKVFVYGTLKRNEPNHHWLQDPQNGFGKFISEGVTKTKYPLIITTKYNIPFLLYNPGDGHQIKGEIYEVDDKMLSKLDILEAHPKYYEREIDEIIVQKGDSTETVSVWVYFLKKFKKTLLSLPKLDNYSSLGPHGLEFNWDDKGDISVLDSEIFEFGRSE